MMLRALLLSLAVVLVALTALSACRAVEPTNRPISMCMKSCAERASRQCSESECERGCELILDRIVEREGTHVIGCVARQSRGCGDIVWAECASNIGAHADGGPPAPPPPADDWE